MGAKPTVCATERCGRPIRARGLCVTCYGVARKQGMPRVRRYSPPASPVRIPLIDRLWKKTTIAPEPEHTPGIGECYRWTGSHTKKGYGRIGRGQRAQGVTTVHVASWDYHFPDKPRGELEVCHKCDVRDCWRPEHLSLGTRLQNMNDMVSKGRHWRQATPVETALAIRADAGMQCYTTRQLAEKHGVSVAVAYQISTGRTWTHIN